MGSDANKCNQWILDRELGSKSPKNFQSQLTRHLFSSIACVSSWKPSHTVDNTHHGGIFNFDFSPDGSMLVAACERRSILMFDPFNGSLLTAKNNAHSDCVNCVRFLDTRMFATCSDDTTVVLWDTRYMKHKIRTLQGHSNWVKNIEYDSSNELLVTSGFDGSIYTWDINKYSEASDCNFQRVFYTNGLMRTKLTPDNTKLVIATAGGYLMVIHDLDLDNLADDLHGFKPNMYRLMQMSQSPIRQGYQYNHVFSRQRNRVELISDFPPENEAEMVASLEVHPQGWCVVSRNTSSDESTEWTCVHDIQSYCEEDEEEKEIEDEEEEEEDASHRQYQSQRLKSPSHERDRDSDVSTQTLSEAGSSNPSRASSPSFVVSLSMNDSSQSTPSHSPRSRTPTANEGSETNSSSPRIDIPDSHVSGAMDSLGTQPSTSDLMSGSSIPSISVSMDSPGTPTRPRSARDRLRESVTFIIRSGSSIAERTWLLSGQDRKDLIGPKPRIYKNRPRLTHYVEEPNVGRGFIKEVCFSSDGRLVCSPFGFGIRLLAFNPSCDELSDCVPDSSQKLYEVTSNMSHTSAVVTTKFSPTHCMLVSGCLDGKVDFHQPRL